MNRRAYLSLACVGIAATISGCNGASETQQSGGDDEATPQSDTAESDTDTVATFEGTSARRTESFETFPQLHFDIRYSGVDGFEAWLVDPDGDTSEQLLINVPNPGFRGTVTVHDSSLPEEVALDVRADGVDDSDVEFGWEIIITKSELQTV